MHLNIANGIAAQKIETEKIGKLLEFGARCKTKWRTFGEIFRRLQPLALLVLRVALAIIFIFHGYPKLTHTHGDLQKLFVEHGMPGYFAMLAGVIETFGGGLLLIGLLARPAALLLAIEMCVAIWKVHSVHGIYSVRDYEFPLALAAACFVLASVGAG